MREQSGEELGKTILYGAFGGLAFKRISIGILSGHGINLQLSSSIRGRYEPLMFTLSNQSNCYPVFAFACSSVKVGQK